MVVFASGAVGVLMSVLEDLLSELTHNAASIVRKSRWPCSHGVPVKSATLKVGMQLIDNDRQS